VSQKYPGGVINKNPVVPSGPYQNSTASGVWTLDQAAQYKKADNWPTSGNIDPSAFIENLFSTWLYTGNDATQSASTGISLSTNGGLVWTKRRNGAASHFLVDTVRGNNKPLNSNSTAAQTVAGVDYITPTTTGYTIQNVGNINTTGETYASWTFREQAKFFDIVTYTGDGSASPRQIAHSLGSVPGFIVIKRTDTTSDWTVWHRSVTGNAFLQTTDAWQTGYTRITTPDSTTFTVGASTMVNASGGTYVAYLFAHDAGGFGLSGTDNVISCGSFTMDASGNPASVTLGYEPQMVIVKRTDSTSNWYMEDNMRGLPVTGNGAQLYANTSGAEAAQNIAYPNATGFTWNIGIPSATYIYIAIRRGPMKVPTSGTSVFNTVTYAGNGTAGRYVSGVGFAPDFVQGRDRNRINAWSQYDRMRGANQRLTSSAAEAETTIAGVSGFDQMDGVTLGNSWMNTTGYSDFFHAFRRAPGFFDVVCYTGTGVARTINHNLAAVPELMIVKDRPTAGNGRVYTASGGAGVYLRLFSTSSDSGNTATTTIWNNTAPTSSVFSVGASSESNFNARTYVAYLFGTVAGVSKVGSYTGTGATQTINCGFSSGSRFVLIKKSTSTAPDRNWYVWDSARGITSGNDPYLLLNTTDAEVTSTDYINTAASGFQIVTSDDAVNASGVTYIFLAIA